MTDIVPNKKVLLPNDADDLAIKINLKEFPMLKSLKKKDLERNIHDMFLIGYRIYFPNIDENNGNIELKEISVKIENLRKQIEDSNVIDKLGEKLDPLNLSLSKLLGLQSASAKKGELGENIIQNAFLTRYGDVIYEDKSKVDHSGDAWVYLSNKEKIMVEAKNYTNTINKNEVEKMEYDMKFNNIKFCLFLSLNASIQGFRDMDFHTFSHNGECYFAIMVANLSNDICKLDLAFSMIRKLMELINSPEKFPWIQTKIKENLNRVNDIIKKNYLLRDNFYTMEKSIVSSMDMYHKQIRDYQYEMESIIKQLTTDINSTMVNSIEMKKTNKDYMLIHKDKKIYQVVNRIIDIFDKKKWEVNDKSNNKYEIIIKGNTIGLLEILLKKTTINFPNNQLDLIFNVGNNKQNSTNLKILETLDY